MAADGFTVLEKQQQKHRTEIVQKVTQKLPKQSTPSNLARLCGHQNHV